MIRVVLEPPTMDPLKPGEPFGEVSLPVHPQVPSLVIFQGRIWQSVGFAWVLVPGGESYIRMQIKPFDITKARAQASGLEIPAGGRA